jgi:uncharacterized protein DUF4234
VTQPPPDPPPPPGPPGPPPDPPGQPPPGPPGQPPPYGTPAYPAPAYPVPAYGAPGYAAPAPPPAERVRIAWQQRADTDYRFDFWTAFGWTILTCGIYGIYVVYQLVRRSRDHNARRLEMLDAATALAWQQSEARGISNELQPNFNRIAAELAVLRRQTTQFRDPVVWMLLSIIASGIVQVILFILLDGDLVDHDRAEGAIEHELSVIYGRLGAAVPAPDPSRMKERYNYAGRVVATILTCGIYGLWWEYNIMNDANEHYDHNWLWEDALAASVQQLAAA